MAGVIRQVLSQAIQLGPFLDATDAVTPETGLTIANTDILVSKNGGAFAAKNSGGATHDTAGWYTATLDTTDTGTTGILLVYCKMAGALPVWREFQVMGSNTFGAIYGSSASGFDGSGQVDIGRIGAISTGVAGLARGTQGIIRGAFVTGTLSTTQATTDLTGYADDILIGRTLVPYGAGMAATGCVGVVTDYASTGGLLTFQRLHDGAPFAAAPANGDTFVLV